MEQRNGGATFHRRHPDGSRSRDGLAFADGNDDRSHREGASDEPRQCSGMHQP